MQDVIRIISLGAGVQSTALTLMAARGVIGPMPSCAIFADTQAEPKAVYKNLEWLMRPGFLPFPVYIVTGGNLWKSASTIRHTKDGKRTYISTGIPVYTVEGLRKGMGRRQCTRTFKIDPVNKKARELLGLKRIKADSGHLVEMWMGISTDEASRMKPAGKHWVKARWPLIEHNYSRAQCLEWLANNGYPEPPRSACTFCPFHDDAEWERMEPSDFIDCVEKEKQIQNAYKATSELRSVPYFHAERIPLDQVFFDPNNLKTRDSFNNECEGMCGV